MIVVYCVISLLLVSCASSIQDSCYSTRKWQYPYFGPLTAYEAARNPQGIPVVPGCRPLQVWMVASYGAHWRSLSDTGQFVSLLDLRDEVLSNHERGRGSLCVEDLESLRSWRQFLVSSGEEDSLTPQGRRDSYALGARVRGAFPDLFSRTNASTDFVFRHTKMHRSKETAEYFAKGLFGIDFEPHFPEPVPDDRLLEAFNNCPAWKLKNDKVQEKVDSFIKSRIVQEVFHNVSLRLGFNYDLPHYVVNAMYEWCAYETALVQDTPPAWCAAFTTRELKVLEYVEDLKSFYKVGPGDRSGMNRKLGCALVKDMFTRFTELEEDPDVLHPAGVFYFGQTETLALVAARLGLLADRHPLSTRSYTTHGQRLFRSSALLPLGGNLIATFYQCSSGERHRVMFLVSEHVVAYTGCPGGLCPWSLIKHRLSRVVHNSSCNDHFCFHLPHSWLPLSTVELWSIIAVISTVLFVIHIMRAVNRLTE